MRFWDIPNEDEHWERVREELEAPPRSRPDEPPEPEKDMLFLDDLAEGIEEKHGCKMSELWEGDLMDIVYEQTGIEATSAKYDDNLFCIEYSFLPEAAGWY